MGSEPGAVTNQPILTTDPSSPTTFYTVFLVVILLLAFALRTYNLTAVPPGLTHDEANHGREALGILDGELLFYFPLNYGSEPLYSYTVAGLMATVGENRLSLRLVNVFMSLLTMSMAYAWAARAFDRRVAILAMGITAVSFWSLASSREALRAGMLPFFMTTAVWFFWQALTKKPTRKVTLAFGLAVAATLHIYLAARVVWLVFPAFLFYLALCHRDLFRKLWRPTLLGLLLAGLLVLPMFVYLRYHPEALTRLDMLDGPLQALRSGDLRPILQNVGGALLGFVWPGYGDQFLAYNIPGRPVLQAITAVFFVSGILVSAWRWKRPAYAFLLLWFAVGISPSLITGATANTTRNLAALTAVYLLPAVGFIGVGDFLTQRHKETKTPRKDWFVRGVALVWLMFAGWTTGQNYFVRWGQSPEVRDAYMHTLITSLHDLAANPPTTAVVISSIYPGVAHDPSVALVTLPDQPFAMRWMDARYALILPQGETATAVIPAATPPNPLFADWLTPQRTVHLRPDDLNPAYTIYHLNPLALPVIDPLANFNDGLHLLTAAWEVTAVGPGETAQLIAIWRVVDPAKVGPQAPPLNRTDMVLFTQILSADGGILAQRDSLEAPSWGWQTGDIIIQAHPIFIPPDAESGSYRAIVGVYDRLSEERLPVLDANGGIVDTFSAISNLHVERMGD